LKLSRTIGLTPTKSKTQFVNKAQILFVESIFGLGSLEKRLKQNTYTMSANEFQMDDSFASFVQELEQAEQPKACSIDNPECEACGS